MERINNSLINANIKLVDEIKELKKEIERLNNIINELEKYIKFDYLEECKYQANMRKSCLMQGDYPVRYYYYYSEQITKLQAKYLNKLQELKGVDKE